MTDTVTATAEPIEVPIGEHKFKMSPMTDEDIATMDQWIRTRHIRIARESLPDDASEDQKDRTERIALLQASTMSFMSGAGLVLLRSPEAIAMLFWVSIRQNHPDITPDIIRPLLLDPKNLNTLQKEWNRINKVLQDEVKKKKR